MSIDWVSSVWRFSSIGRKHQLVCGTRATSPLYARQSFWTVVATLEAVGWRTAPYHALVPSLGEWGFILAGRTAYQAPATIAVSKGLKADLERFIQISKGVAAPTYSLLTMFGVPFFIQYSFNDTNAPCLFDIHDWGSSGNAQVFYRLTPQGETNFSFWDCVR
jgi:hypothetical protein